MADTRLRAIIESIYQSQGTDAAKAGMQGVKQATTEMGIAQQAAQAQMDMLTKKMRELSAEVAKGNKTIDEATKEFNEYKATLKQLPPAVEQASEGTEQLATSTNALSGVLGKLAAAGILAKIGQEALEFGKASVQAAGDAAEMQSKFNVVFGDSAPQAQAALQELGDQVNRSAIDLQGMAASIQDTFVPLGFARDQAADLSVQLTQLAVDVGSFNNVADADVMRDFQSALVGNTETVRKYGIVITEANTKQKAYEMGIAEVGTALTEQEKVQARLQLIMEGTTDAQGDAIRTADSYANTQKGLEAAVLDLQVALGELATSGLSGVNKEATTLIGNLTDLVGWVGQIDNAFVTHNENVVKTSSTYDEYTAEMQRAAEVVGRQIVFTDELTEAQAETADVLIGLTEEEYLNEKQTSALEAIYAAAKVTAYEWKGTSDELTASLAAQNSETTTLSMSIDALIEGLDFGKQSSSLLSDALRSQAESTAELNRLEIELLFLTGEITAAERADLIAKNEQISKLEKLTNALEDGKISWEQYYAAIADGKITSEEMTSTLGAAYIAQQELNGQLDAGVNEMDELYGTAGGTNERMEELQETMATGGERMLLFAQAALDANLPLTTLAGAADGLAAPLGTAADKAKELEDNLTALDGKEIGVTINIMTNGSVPAFNASGAGKNQGQGGTSATGFAEGADFIVPPGFPNDSYGPLYVQSGERVQVTPAGQVESGGRSNGNTIVQVFLDGAQIAARVSTYAGQNARRAKNSGVNRP